MTAASRFAIVGARVIDPDSGLDGERTVVVDAGRIVALETPGPLSADLPVVEARGQWLLPGFVDLHVHLREPGEEHKETIATGARSGAAGGFTTLVAMPNTKPVIDTAALVQFVLKKSAEAGYARVLPSAAITRGQKGESLAEFVELAEAGAVCFTDDGRPVANAGVMRRALEYSLLVGKPVMVHEEEPALSGGCMHEGDVSVRLGLKGIPGAAEDVMVHRDIALARLTGAHLHVAHISTAESVRAVREARARGIHVTAEATPHHFALTHEAVRGYDTHAKMSPPLREEEDRLAVLEGLADGTIDAIATDHAPHAVVDKEVDFDHAANGIVGLETALSLTLEAVRSGALPLHRALAALTSAPAGLFGLPYGRIAVGAAADLVLVDPAREWTFDVRRSYSKSRNSPFDGRRFTGQVMRTFVDGRQVHAVEG